MTTEQEYNADLGPKTNGLAIGSLVTGILGCCCMPPIIMSIIAIVLGHISLGQIKRSNGEQGGRKLAIGGLVTGYIGLIVGILIIGLLLFGFFHTIDTARDKARRVNDAGNLKQIGLGLLMYSGDYEGDFPDDLAVLAEQNYLMVGKVWVCPASGTAAPTTPAQIRSGSNCDYVYVGKGLRDDNKNATSTVIAYTKPGSFKSDWINFLFIDGHVEGVAAGSAEEAAAMKGFTLGAQ